MDKKQKNKSKNNICYQQIEMFISYLKVEKNYSEHTIYAYKKDILKLLAFIENKNIKNWQNVDQDCLNSFIIKLRATQIDKRSIRRYLSSIRSFFAFLSDNKILNNNVAKNIVSPKFAQKLPKIITFEQLSKMIEIKNNSFKELRDVAMVDIIYCCALRASELISLDIEDIDFSEEFIKVVGKGAKTRFVPIGKLSILNIKKYLKIRPICNNNALFLNLKKMRISVRSVQNIIKIRATNAGINFNVYPHMLRHSAATHFLQSSHDLRSVQEFLGHKSIKSTQVYTHLDFLELSKIYDKYHPRAKK